MKCEEMIVDMRKITPDELQAEERLNYFIS